MHVNPSLDQAAFRGRDDDGSESAATWKAAAARRGDKIHMAKRRSRS